MIIDIRTRYTGPTDTRGARVTARALGRSLTIPYPYRASDPHEVVARLMARATGADPDTLRLLDVTGARQSWRVTADDDPTRPATICRRCHGDVTHSLTPRGAVVVFHAPMPLDSPDVPGEYVANGTRYVSNEEHAPRPVFPI